MKIKPFHSLANKVLHNRKKKKVIIPLKINMYYTFSSSIVAMSLNC